MTREKADELDGHYDDFTKTIEIDTKLHPETIQATLLHEAIHVISDHMHLGLSERQVRGLEVGISSFLRDNGVRLTNLYVRNKS